MSSIFDELMGQLQEGGISQISQALGANEQQVTQAAMGALPALLSGLAKNSASPDGASALASALDRNHDGSVLDNLAGFLGQGGTSDGTAILGHVLGNRTVGIEQAVSQGSGLDMATVSKLMAMLAPLVMGALGKTKRQQRLDPADLGGLLGREQQQARQKAPEAMDMFTKMLDQDGDGSISDELISMGGSLLGGLFGKRR